MDKLTIIKNSFEDWYNATNHTNVSIVINYSDEQTLFVKAYHKVTITMSAIGIKNGLSYTIPLLSISENYNHGVTSEQEAKDGITKKFLNNLFSMIRNI